MPKQPPFEIVYAPETADHLATIDRKHYGLIETTISEQLTHTPDRPTRNRKKLRLPAPSDATWELRFGPQNVFRVFYSVDLDSRIVSVLAIGRKVGNRLLVGNEEYEL